MKLFFIGCLAAGLLHADVNLPEGKGREEVTNICGNCHGLEATVKQKLGKKSWIRLVNEMVGRGAAGTDEQLQLIIDYLSANFGKPINVNKATSKELQEAFAISPEKGDSLVKYRENGEFKTLADLLKVPGISADKIEPLSANIVF